MATASSKTSFANSSESTFESEGFQIIPNLLSSSECDALAEVLSNAFAAQQKDQRARIGGIRNLLSAFPLVAQTASSFKILEKVSETVQRKIFPVRTIFFDKTPETNWTVPWHQDLSIAVSEQINVNGFDGWSLKGGVQHVQPPMKILESMVTLRLHLDDCLITNGALRVLPESHRNGKLTSEQIAQRAREGSAFTCEVPRGGALLMRPLLLHSSLPSRSRGHRRGMHIEYAGCKLPGGLKWFEEVVK